MNLYTTGAMVFGLAIVISNIKVMIFSFDHTIASFFFNLGSMLLYGLALIGFSTVSYTNIYKAFHVLIGCWNFHLGNILAVAFCSLFDFAHETYMRFEYDEYQSRVNCPNLSASHFAMS